MKILGAVAAGITLVMLTGLIVVAAIAAVVLPSAAACGDGSGSEVTAMSGKWRAPMASAYSVTSEFGPRYHPVLHVTKVHTGIDLVASGNKTIVAAADGKVVERGFNTAYGNQVVIDNGGGITTRYAHMAAPAKVHRGQKVGAGTALGTMGATGYVTGPHLHFEVIRKGTPINPKPFMAAHGAPLNGKATASTSTKPASGARAPQRATPVSTKIPSKITAKGPGGRPHTIEGEQLRIAKAIARIGTERGAGSRGIVIAYMTAFQESGMRQINYGDRDSLSVFQQRPGAGWGTPAQIMRLDYTIAAFFGGPDGPNHGSPRGLLDVKGWQKMGLGEAAQTVQVSAFPDAYNKWEPLARSLHNVLGGGGDLDADVECSLEAAAPTSGLRVMSWDVEPASSTGRLAGSIRDQGADVVALQASTTHRDRVRRLVRSLRPTYRLATQARGQTLLYDPARISLPRGNRKSVSTDAGVAQLFTVKDGGQRVVVTSLRISNTLGSPQRVAYLRRAQTAAASLRPTAKTPIVHAAASATQIGGTGGDRQAAGYLRQVGFRSSESEASTRSGQQWASVNHRTGPARGPRTDHVLINPRLLRVPAWRQIVDPGSKRPLSQHNALVVDLTWRTTHAA